MGLLSRFGKNVVREFDNSAYGHSLGEVAVPSALFGAVSGAGIDAAMPGDPTMEGMGGAAGLGALAGAAVPGGFALKRLIVALMRSGMDEGQATMQAIRLTNPSGDPTIKRGMQELFSQRRNPLDGQ